MSSAVVVAYFREVINPSQETIYAKEGKGLGRQLPPQPCVCVHMRLPSVFLMPILQKAGKFKHVTWIKSYEVLLKSIEN